MCVCGVCVCVCVCVWCVCSSLKGEVLGSCKDFRMNTFTPDALGIIRLILDTARSNFLGEAPLDAPVAPISLFHHQGRCWREGTQIPDIHIKTRDPTLILTLPFVVNSHD